MKTICRICEKSIKPFFDLGRQPLANSLLKSQNAKESKYPLVLNWCNNCSLVQLNYIVSPKKLFSKYVWVTGTSTVAKNFSNDFYEELVKRTGDSRKNYVLEIASNDGTFLKPFIKNGYKAIGIDPAKNIVNIAVKNGVPTINAFWNSVTAKRLFKKQGPAQVIFARNVMAHVANTKDFVKAMAYALDENGTLAIEVHYAGEIISGLQYDSIYHEHLYYFTLKSLEGLLGKFGLFVFDALKSPISGGAMIVYASKQKRKESRNLIALRKKEKEEVINIFKNWNNIALKSFKHRDEFLFMLANIKNKGAIVGWGASARSSTLLNFCGIDSSFIPIIADKNELKTDLYTAGSHILIKSPEEAMKLSPKYVVILGWNFAKEIIEDLKNKFNYKGEYIIPLPLKPKILKQ